MGNYGFIKVAAATPKLKVADCVFNTTEILKVIADAEKSGVKAIVFPEASITGYTANDLFHQRLLIEGAVNSIDGIKRALAESDIMAIVGTPLEITNRLYNVAVVIHRGQILGVVPKTFLPNYNEFYDKRWFSSARELSQPETELCGQTVPVGTDLIFETKDFRFAIEICEDLWTPVPPSAIHSLYGAEVIFNLSASNETIGKNEYRRSLVNQQSARCIAGYVYAAAGNGESTTDLVFSGSSMIAENGNILASSERFSFDSQFCVADIDIDRLRNDRLKNKSFTPSEYNHFSSIKYRTITIDTIGDDKKADYKLDRYVNPMPFVPSKENMDARCSEIFAIQVGGLAKRLLHINAQTAVVGVSGGLDSTLALLVMVKAFDKLNIPRANIYGITMPGFGTTDRTYNNALKLMQSLGVTIREIPIQDAVMQHFKDIGHDKDVHDITYENSQARERTQILMDYANKVNGLVIGTGDLSELALGWCTYNGDHMSMYAVNTSIPKTLVKTLVGWIAGSQLDKSSQEILIDILDTPVSPELLPAGENGEILQVTEETVGPYILHDFFLYNMLRFGYEPRKIYFLAKIAFEGKYDDAIILKWLRTFYWRFFSQQFKRNCIPDGPKVGSINLSPRGDWRMVSDASVALWMQQLDAMQ
ncbi:NAD(+) synthase [Dysgonomonas macrotermitis]|uniref:Glutamine-dependent NAD(+) synthetase n=1 Tax=Dysgonomonas macrotermitis TaxID=1346286 RepID=A0A1M4YKI9_9BACT|nr:NAD(+) synthase [Dysgonomonas macrotermitis]SHF06178.1 NAD+ synthase (glutamine-hydrolysing) [Dysgonomonas macrotermitis]